jgi:spermidine synthase
MNIDGFAGTTMPKYSSAPGAMDFLRYDITNLAYYARDEGRSAVIGVGSGRDVLSAHIFGFRDITAVELNPIFVDLLTDPQKLRSYAGVADLPGVHFVVDDGRSWFARTTEQFDLVQMSMVDTFAATGVGAFSLSENGLYTVEGWNTFLNALSPDGLFTVSRWHSPTATVEIGRVVSLASASLMTLGVENPSNHIYVAGVSNLATIIVSRRPFAATDLQKLNEASQTLHFSVIACPGQTVTDPLLADLLAARSLADLNARAVRYFLDVSPPTDARPFFFNQLRLTHPGDMITMARALRAGQDSLIGEGLVAVGNLIAMGTLFLIIVLSTLVVVFVIVLPARSSVRLVDLRIALSGSAYFLLIGLGFMFIEIGLIQRISIFLGHPVYALSVGLFSIILSTGIGSLVSERFTLERPVHFLIWIGALAVYVLSLPVWLPLVTHSWLESSTLFLRAFASVLVIFPAGLLMGYGFPTGMRLTTAIDPKPTPWLWGVNGAAGVLAAGLGVACSIGFSVDATIRVGGICYIMLLPFALLLRRISLGRKGETAKA